MTLSPTQRRFALFVHVLVSVAFPGAVAGFLALAIVGLAGGTEVYAAMEIITTSIIVPLCLLALASGVVCSIGTPWGLVRHWWVLVKLVLTVPSTLILLIHLEPIRRLARTAHLGGEAETQIQLVLASGAAIAVLVLLTVLSIYKPRGRTPLGG